MDCDMEKQSAPVRSHIQKEWEASWISRVTFTYINSLVRYGWKHQIVESDLGDLLDYDTTPVIVNKFWKSQHGDKNLSVQDFFSHRKGSFLLFALFRTCKKELLISGICKLIGDGFSLSGPIFLGLVLNWIEEGSNEEAAGMPLGYWYAIGIFLCSLVQNMCLQWHHHLVIRIGIHFRACLRALIFEKSIRVLNGQLDEGTEKVQAVTLQSVDVEMIMLVPFFVHYVWAAPILTGVILYLLINEIGLSALSGFGFMLIFMPIQWQLGKFFRKLSAKSFKFTDVRVKNIKEMIGGIKLVKINVLEDYFKTTVTEARTVELRKKKYIALVDGVNSSLTHSATILVTVITFVVFSYVADEELTAERAFTSLAFFQLLRLPLFIFPMLVKTLASGLASSVRVLKLFSLPEIQEYRKSINELEKASAAESPERHMGKYAVIFESAAFAWTSTQQSVVLSDINVKILRGKSTAVVGKVGSGKTSFLSSILGSMCLKKGEIYVEDLKNGEDSAMGKSFRNIHHTHQDGTIIGGISYCAQTPFILNNTVKENILFGSLYDRNRLELVIWACCLEQDLKQLPEGLMTQIGERGVNLSGGQQARISLARAIYRRQPAMYIFDDIFSALDVHVCKKIYERCIKTLLRNKTCIFATHDIDLANRADSVLHVMPKESSNVTSTVVFRNNGEPSNNNNDYSGSEDGVDVAVLDERLNTAIMEYDKPAKLDSTFIDKSKDTTGNSIDDSGNKAESREVGTVSRKIYMEYFRALTGPVFFAILFTQIAFQVGVAGTDFWLAHWANEDGQRSATYFSGIYALIALGAILLSCITSILWAFGGILAARNLHEKMLARVLLAPILFFEETPAGRIVNRFANDTNDMDSILPSKFKEFFNLGTKILMVLIVQAFVLPYILIGYLPLMLVYLFILECYRRTYREVNRVDNVTKSPIYSILGEAINGADTIRAYGDIERFSEINTRRNDLNTQSHFKKNTLNRWLGLRLDWLGAVITFLVVALAVALRDKITAGEIGIVITYALTITNLFNWLVRNATDTEAAMNSIERIVEYSKDLPQERAMIVEANRPDPKSWPKTGEVKFVNVEMRYRPELPLTLKKLSFTLPGGTKVGVCGRTGSGKSSLLVSLLRLVEIESEGAIIIDGVNVSEIGLSDLRRALALVPQHPLLFSGTLRGNLDRQNIYSDEQIWNALECVKMASKIESYAMEHESEQDKNSSNDQRRKHALNLTITEGGTNFSAGERQLLCFVRVLLRGDNVKLLCLDEASSSIDRVADTNLQAAIRNNFKKATVITIAHRINTIKDNDLILVLDDGKISEFDKPEVLLRSPESSFSQLMAASSLSTLTSENPDDEKLAST